MEPGPKRHMSTEDQLKIQTEAVAALKIQTEAAERAAAKANAELQREQAKAGEAKKLARWIDGLPCMDLKDLSREKQRLIEKGIVDFKLVASPGAGGTPTSPRSEPMVVDRQPRTPEPASVAAPPAATPPAADAAAAANSTADAAAVLAAEEASSARSSGHSQMDDTPDAAAPPAAAPPAAAPPAAAPPAAACDAAAPTPSALAPSSGLPAVPARPLARDAANSDG